MFENNRLFLNVLLVFVWKSTALQYQNCLKALLDLPKFFIIVKEKKKKKPISKV